MFNSKSSNGSKQIVQPRLSNQMNQDKPTFKMMSLSHKSFPAGSISQCNYTNQPSRRLSLPSIRLAPGRRLLNKLRRLTSRTDKRTVVLILYGFWGILWFKRWHTAREMLHQEGRTKSGLTTRATGFVFRFSLGNLLWMRQNSWLDGRLHNLRSVRCMKII